MQNYFDNNRAMSHHGPGQGANTGASRLDFLPTNVSPNQYSAITVKWDGSQNKVSKQNDYTYQEQDPRLKRSTGYMKHRQ